MSLQFYTTDQLTLDRMAILYQGPAGAGKTKQMCDALAAHRPDCLAVNFGYKLPTGGFVGEDGLLTAKALALPYVNIQSGADWEELLKEILMGTRLKGLKAIGLDGLPYGYRMFMQKFTMDEAPEPTWYQKSHPHFENQIVRLRRAVPLMIATSTSDRSVDQVRDDTWTTPDLPGRMAAGVARLFDFVFYLEQDVQMGKTVYRLYTARPKTVIKGRLPRALPPIITDPSWPKIRAEIEAALEGKPSPIAAVGVAAKPTTAAGR